MGEYLGWNQPVTHREHLTWLCWISEELNNPGITEHYLMMVGAEVRRGRVKHPKQVKLQDMRVDFKRSEGDEEEWTAEERKTYSNWLKQAYLARWKTKPPDSRP